MNLMTEYNYNSARWSIWSP